MSAVRLVFAIGLWLFVAPLLRPCELRLQAQTREDQIFCEYYADNPCNYPQCAYLDLQYCDGPPTLPGDSTPSCCGTGVDCRCDWYNGNTAYLDGGDFYCDDGWSYCCGHDQCCHDLGAFGCYTVCWMNASFYC
jgi:hypothetical protein